jgi:hypothetical protein
MKIYNMPWSIEWLVELSFFGIKPQFINWICNMQIIGLQVCVKNSNKNKMEWLLNENEIGWLT